MDQHVDADALLPGNALGGLLLEEGGVIGVGELLGLVGGAGSADVVGLGEGADGRRGEEGELELSGLDLGADGVGGLAGRHLGGDGGDAGADGGVVDAGGGAAGGHGGGVGLELSLDRVAALEETLREDGDLNDLLLGEGEPREELVVHAVL